MRTASPSPRVKLETGLSEEPVTEQQEIPMDDNTDDNDMSVLDAGAMDIDDIDEYHPNRLTPSQAAVLQPRSPIRTRSKTRVAVDDAALIHYALTQLTLKQGLKKFGKDGESAVTKEIQQLHDREVFHPVHADTLTEEQKRNH